MSNATGTGKYEALLERCRQPGGPCRPPSPIPARTRRSRRARGGGEGADQPILVGPAAKIEEIAGSGHRSAKARIVDAPHSHAAAAKAVELVRKGEAELLMKGSLHTDELLGAVVARETGLRTAAASATCSSWTCRPITRC